MNKWGLLTRVVMSAWVSFNTWWNNTLISHSSECTLFWKTGSTFLFSQWNEELTLCSAAPRGPWGQSLYGLVDQLRETALWRNHPRGPRHTLPQVRPVSHEHIRVSDQILTSLYLLPVVDGVCRKVIRIWGPLPEMCSGSPISLSLSVVLHLLSSMRQKGM